ncbi:MAG: flavin reductase family protein [Anaerolineales bacterium]
MPISPNQMRRAMRQWASGITLVTVAEGSLRHGMTVSSFASVSLEPPYILVSLENTSRTNELVGRINHFAVAILSEEQRSLSDQFAGRLGEDDDRFQGVDFFTTDLGNPIPEGCLAFMDCKVSASYELGTHTVFIGLVEESDVPSDGSPLLYYDQDYAKLHRPE